MADQGRVYEAVVTDNMYPEQVTHVTSRIRDRLVKIAAQNHSYGTVSIFKVPEKHRMKNTEAYTPRIASIGFIHYGESQLKSMEEHKVTYLNHFLSTFRIPLEHMVEYVQVHEKPVCRCYEDIYTHKLKDEHAMEPSEVLLLDGIFVIELFLNNCFPEMGIVGDLIFDNPWVSADILHDLILFENQLPLWFLTTLYDTFVLKSERRGSVSFPPFTELVYKYFERLGNTEKLPPGHDLDRATNLVGFLSILLYRGELIVEQEKRKGLVLAESKTNKQQRKRDHAKPRSITELKAAGVRFRRGIGGGGFVGGVLFKQGVLSIPLLTVNDLTETFLHNLIVFEQTGYGYKHITNYVYLLASLIKTDEDVDLLMEHEILKNQYGSSAKVAKLFSDLYNELALDPHEFYFAELRYQLNEYSRSPVHKCKAIISTTPIVQAIGVATVIGTVLGIIQTVCSVLSVTSAK